MRKDKGTISKPQHDSMAGDGELIIGKIPRFSDHLAKHVWS